MKEITSCPYGHKCEKMVDENTIERCAWYQEIKGENPQTGEPLDKRMCAVTFQNLLLVQLTSGDNDIVQTLNAFRNNMDKQGQVALKMQALMMDGSRAIEKDS